MTISGKASSYVMIPHHQARQGLALVLYFNKPIVSIYIPHNYDLPVEEAQWLHHKLISCKYIASAVEAESTDVRVLVSIQLARQTARKYLLCLKNWG